MSSAALSDLDWEVKLEALEFWSSFIEECFVQQEMVEYWNLSRDDQNSSELSRYDFDSFLSSSLMNIIH